MRHPAQHADLARQPGLAVFTIVKAGFVFSGKAGSGLVIARLPDGSWSAPSCIATAGVGWGLQIGAGAQSPYIEHGYMGSPRLADLTEVVIVLNSDEAVKAFSRGGNVTVGGESWQDRTWRGLMHGSQVVFPPLRAPLAPVETYLLLSPTPHRCSATAGQRVRSTQHKDDSLV